MQILYYIYKRDNLHFLLAILLNIFHGNYDHSLIDLLDYPFKLNLNILDNLLLFFELFT